MNKFHSLFILIMLLNNTTVYSIESGYAPPTTTKKPQKPIICGSCHRFPTPQALPKDKWPEVIQSMTHETIQKNSVKLTPKQIKQAIAYYNYHAPNKQPWIEPTAAVSKRLNFHVQDYSPKLFIKNGIRKGAVANVNFTHFLDPKRWDVLITEMRSRSVMLLATREKLIKLGPVIFAFEMNYPVHTEVVDINGNGYQDILVASIGGMNPGNETNGSVSILLQSAPTTFDHHLIASNLGRVVDARAADLDGDKDLDIIVAAFGWRGPGALYLLRNQTTDWSKPTFDIEKIDPRDGYIHVEITDLNHDGRLDFIALLSQEHEQVIAYLNLGKMKFQPKVLYQAPHPAWGHSGLQLVDMDQDQDIDILLSHGDSLDDMALKPYHGVSWLENKGNLAFDWHRIARLYGAQRAVAADMDQDGDLDVVAVAFLPHLSPKLWKEKNLDSVIWMEQTAEGWKKHAIEKALCKHPTVAVADYNEDGKADVVVGNWSWLRMDGSPIYETDTITLFTQK